jgi:DNA primase
MPIPDHLVEQVRLQADIVELLSEHTRLKRSGRTFRGPCPLHGGEGPNFSVDPAKGFYKCFVCGEGGGVFTFYMKHLGMTFPDAIRAVAERVGVEIPDERQTQPVEDPNRHFYELNTFAAEWYRKQLWDGDEGREPRAYLERRGIGREAAERYGLGWAPEQWSAFRDAATRAGYRDEWLLELGLAKARKDGREPYDAFRGRIVFPIEDVGGRVVAFGGRILGQVEEHTPKYLNSPESPVYHKGQTLYGLGWSRSAIRREECVLVVEGYMDYVSLAAHGVSHAVAPLGTALTQEQAELIARYTGRAILLYDSDKAGLRATFRSGDELLRAGVEVQVATLPEGEDPDSLVRGQGEAALRRYLRDAVDLLERKVQILDRKAYFSSIKKTRKALDVLLPTVRAAADDLTRDVYLQRVAEKAGVSREALEREIAEAVRQDDRLRDAQVRRQRQQVRRMEDVVYRADVQENPERFLVLLLLRDESWIERSLTHVSPEDFWNQGYRAIYELLREWEGRRDPDGAWLQSFPPEVQPLLEELRAVPAETTSPADAFFHGSVALIRSRSFYRQQRDLNARIDSGDLNEQEQLSLLMEKQQLNKMGQEDLYIRKYGFLWGYTSDRQPSAVRTREPVYR